MRRTGFPTRLVASTAVAGAIAAASVGLAGAASAAPAHTAASHTKLHGYPAARVDWIKGAHRSAAETSKLWRYTEHHLNAARYTAAHHELRELRSVPLTNTTAKQRRLARHEIRALNKFFHTPGLYGVDPHPYYSHAKADWIKSAHVPAASSHHYLASARHELAKADGYRTQRRELKDLEAIPLTNTTAKQRASARHLVHELNQFFHLRHR